MTPRNQIIVGDCLETMRAWPDAFVQCVVTSPPYWGLRDYGVDGQIGLEATPAEYLDRMTAVFREVRRVLRDDGVAWVNMGDGYASQGGPGWQGKNGQRADRRFTAVRDSAAMRDIGRRPPDSLKAKDLIGMPWRLAFALQADGWYLRSDCIWHKPNPMPESVTDRPTKSHEYVFLLSKSQRYFYDAEAVREDGPTYTRKAGGYVGRDGNNASRFGGTGGFGDSDVTTVGRNLRTVWTIQTQAFPGSHFATFPEKLVETCILAGTSQFGCCAECGKPWRRMVDRQRVRTRPGLESKAYDRTNGHALPDVDKPWASAEVGNRDPGRHITRFETTGWLPQCKCHSGMARCIVLDPFMGSGTTAEVAAKMGRDYLGCELNPKYAEMAQERLGLFAR